MCSSTTKTRCGASWRFSLPLTPSLLIHSFSHSFLLVLACDFAVSHSWAFYNFKYRKCIWLAGVFLLLGWCFCLLRCGFFCFVSIVCSCFNALLSCVRHQHAPQQQQLFDDGGGDDPRRRCGKTGKHEEVEHQHLQGSRVTGHWVMWLHRKGVFNGSALLPS